MKKTSLPDATVRAFAIIALATALAACNKGDEQAATAPAPAAQPDGGQAAPAVVESPDDKRMANAVVTGKTAAPVDLKFDILAKPAVGQPFEIELALLPRLAADALEVEITGIPGLTIVSGGTPRFEQVLGGDRHVAKVLAQADAPGIYYANVTAKMITQVQTEVRTFSIPVVVGTVAAAQKTEPAQDASGKPIESMPATESGGPAQPKK